MRALVLIAVLGLGGCASTVPVVPQSLLTCTDQPKSPAAKVGVTQRYVALFVVDLAAAGADCRSKLGSVRRILNPETTRGTP